MKSKRRTADEIARSKTADELIRLAKEGGVEQNYFFTTTFDRYKMQLTILARLQNEINNSELTTIKEYKNRKETGINPLITEYNKTSIAANQTESILLRIIKTFADGSIMENRDDEDDDEITL